jgi:dTDP-4-dehydrorhamnose reductase
MTEQTVLIIGGTGMLGHKLAQVVAATSKFDTHVTCRALPAPAFRPSTATYHADVELEGSLTELARVIQSLQPDFILNAAGAIKHHDLSSNPMGTLSLNGALPHALALLNPKPNGKVIHFSTDCVFTGLQGGYCEADEPDAVDLYGLSKAAGEIRSGRHLTLRTSIIGFEMSNYLGLLEWFFRQSDGATVKGYAKAIFSGLPTITLSRTVLDVMQHHSHLHGLYHVASQPIPKLDLLRRVAAAFGLDRQIVASDDVVIDRSLDDRRFRAATNTETPGWDVLIADLVADYRSLPYASNAPALEISK